MVQPTRMKVQSVGAPLHFFLDLESSRNSKEAEGQTGRDHGHGPAHATEEAMVSSMRSASPR